MSHQDFENIAYAGYFRHFVCVFVFVAVFVIVFVFAFVLCDLWFLNSFHHKLSEYVWFWGSVKPTSRYIDHLWSDGGQTYIHSQSNSTYRLGPSSRMGRVKKKSEIQKLFQIPCLLQNNTSQIYIANTKKWLTKTVQNTLFVIKQQQPGKNEKPKLFKIPCLLKNKLDQKNNK